MTTDSYSIDEPVHYYVEERLVTDPTRVSYAWLLTSAFAATERLIVEITKHGNTRLYGMYKAIG